MRIAVCVKQVPAAGGTVMDPEKGVLVRIASESALNPYDLYAIEAAVQTAEQTGGHITALSMGPAAAEAALRQALAMGADEGILLQDTAFAGADVYATAYTLAQAVHKAGGYDVIFCGQQTTDGDTAQLPFSLAAQLGIPSVGWVKQVRHIHDGHFAVVQECTGGSLLCDGPTPVVLAIGPQAVRPRMPTLAGRLGAQKKPLAVWHLADMPHPDANRYGLAASPTRVKRIYAARYEAKAAPLHLPAAEAARRIARELDEAGGGQP